MPENCNTWRDCCSRQSSGCCISAAMTDYSKLQEILMRGLGIERFPVAVAFLDAPPEGVEKFTGTAPSSCTFWRLAAESRTFYTVTGDHWNCPIGSYTHNAPLP